jgi:hypothetical protein
MCNCQRVFSFINHTHGRFSVCCLFATAKRETRVTPNQRPPQMCCELLLLSLHTQRRLVDLLNIRLQLLNSVFITFISAVSFAALDATCCPITSVNSTLSAICRRVGACVAKATCTGSTAEKMLLCSKSADAGVAQTNPRPALSPSPIDLNTNTSLGNPEGASSSSILNRATCHGHCCYVMTMLLVHLRLELVSKLNASAPQDEQMAGN